MKIYILSLAVGIIVGVLYHVLNVRSPAPPTWALVGLLGMLIGEQAIPFIKQHFLEPTAYEQSHKLEGEHSQNSEDSYNNGDHK